jgi:FeS assembly SUF system protein|tara:strand:- start:181 stop:591 length:411 start_codon:yes stop_codon:yes gene_type:complete
MNESGGPSLADFMPNNAKAGEPVVARLGSPLAPGVKVSDKTEIIKALRTVHDPEIPVNIYDLGLIYDLEVKTDGTVIINMTLTAPACPVAGELPIWVAQAVSDVKGCGEVEVCLVWEPKWTMDLMTDEAKLTLDMF